MITLAQINKTMSKFFKATEIAIAIILFIVLGYSVITGTEIEKIIDVDFWTLSYLISLTTPRILSESEDEKTKQV
jgi:uncharacterized membrane protein